MLSAVELDRVTFVPHTSDFSPTVTSVDWTPLPASSADVADDAPVASPQPMHNPHDARPKMGEEGTPAGQTPPCEVERDVCSRCAP